MCTIATCVALLSSGKFVLSVLPNVEIVTLLSVVFALSLPRLDAIATAVLFVALEVVLWGVLWSVVLYIIYWPLLALVVSFVPKRLATRWRCAIGMVLGVLMTVCFGALSVLIDVLLFIDYFGSPTFFASYAAWYAGGFIFFLTHVIGNIVVLGVGVWPLLALTKRMTKH